VIVLDELLSNFKLGEQVAAVGLQEESALVGVDCRLEQDRALESRRKSAHDQDVRASFRQLACCRREAVRLP
jgi:hypothetical protein